MLPDEKDLLRQVFSSLPIDSNPPPDEEITEAENTSEKDNAIRPIPLKTVEQLLREAREARKD